MTQQSAPLCFLSASPFTRFQNSSRKRLTSNPSKQLVCARVRRSENAPGEFYVDESCIDCDTCRWMTPEVFTRTNYKSAVYQQPKSGDRDLQLSALQAAIACPTGSIHTQGAHELLKTAAESFPMKTEVEGVYYCGYTSPDTFAASSWLLETELGTVLVDCPRYSPLLAKKLKKMNVRFLVMTHNDDVAGHQKWVDELGVTRVMHQADANRHQGTDKCEMQLQDDQFPFELVPGVKIYHIPGHTRGSIGVLHEKSQTFCSGDHVGGRANGELSAFPMYCSYSWNVQQESMRMMATLPFKNLLPGHGRPVYLDSAEHMQEQIQKAAEMMDSITARRP